MSRSSSQWLLHRRHAPYISPAVESREDNTTQPPQSPVGPIPSALPEPEVPTKAGIQLLSTSALISAGSQRITDSTMRMKAADDKLFSKAQLLSQDHAATSSLDVVSSSSKGRGKSVGERKSKVSHGMSMLEVVQQAARLLMHRRNYKTSIPDGPSQNLVRPTLRDFFFEWMEDLRSLWNTEARYLLVDYILAVFPDDVREDDRPSVEKAVMAHVHTLQQAYLSSKSPQERRILVVRATRTQRKREKLNRRLSVVNDPAFPTLRVHAPVYETLGVDGMSSEEDCPGPCPPGGRPTRLVYRKVYLSQDLSKLNAHIDSIHERRAGPRPYLRSAPIPKACTRWIVKLPKNIYDSRALAQLNSAQKKQLLATPNHPFTFHTGLV